MIITISRIVSALILGLVGFEIGQSAGIGKRLPDYAQLTIEYGGLILIGVITGWIVGGLVGKLLQRAFEKLDAGARSVSGAEILVGGVGLLVGLVISILLSLPVIQLGYVGVLMLLPMTLVIAYICARVASIKHIELLRIIGIEVNIGEAQGKLVDSSVLIDGRISLIVKTGFIEGQLIVPVFVLEELQRVADSSDPQRRARGRRGLNAVQKLRRDGLVATPDIDFPDLQTVDSKLVRMAGQEGYAILTTDVNLNKVAQIQQIKVLNIHELADTLKPEFVVGDLFDLEIVRPGKESGQGVGYLDDGTMVIVDNGGQQVGATIEVEVTSVMQTPNGKLVFSKNATG